MPRHILVTRLFYFVIPFVTTLNVDPLAADILRWDTGVVIPGTEGITPGPGVDLSHRSLEYADLSNLDLKGANLSSANLGFARLNGSTLSDVDFTGANVLGTRFDETFSRGFAKEQLYSTSSYQQKDLRQIGLVDPTGTSVLDGWDFTGQNLTGAAFTDCFIGEDCHGTSLIGVDLSGANLSNANLLLSFGLEAGVVSAATTYNQGTLLPLFFDPSAAGITMIASPAGDLNANQFLDAVDIDWLSTWIRGEEPPTWWLPDTMFDLNDDGQVNLQDHNVWVKELKQTWFGDANLDGEFNTADLVVAFIAGKYETGLSCGWAEGDWNGDALFDTNDFVAAFIDGGYEREALSQVFVVPEPSSLWLLAAGWLFAALSRRQAAMLRGRGN